MKPKLLSIAVLFLITYNGVTPLQAQQDTPALTEDSKAIKYIETKPKQGSPQDVMLNIFFLREAGKSTEAAKHLSADLPDWLREAILKRESSKGNPVKIETITYQLRKWNDKWLINLSYNLSDGTYKSESRYPVWEEKQWKIK